MRRIILALAFFVLSLGGAAQAEDTNILVENPYALATTSVQKNGAVFMTLMNESGQDHSVVSAASDVAERIELHTHLMDGDMMMMREVDAYTLPAGESVTLEPMGHHIMLMGLKAPLQAGESFPLTLSLKDGSTLDVDVMIKNPGDVE